MSKYRFSGCRLAGEQESADVQGAVAVAAAKAAELAAEAAREGHAGQSLQSEMEKVRASSDRRLSPVKSRHRDGPSETNDHSRKRRR